MLYVDNGIVQDGQYAPDILPAMYVTLMLAAMAFLKTIIWNVVAKVKQKISNFFFAKQKPLSDIQPMYTFIRFVYSYIGVVDILGGGVL